jgi:hypothetical protein
MSICISFSTIIKARYRSFPPCKQTSKKYIVGLLKVLVMDFPYDGPCKQPSLMIQVPIQAMALMVVVST